jgi:N-acetyl sugar amidotransferase
MMLKNDLLRFSHAVSNDMLSLHRLDYVGNETVNNIRNVQEKYNLPSSVQFCKECVMSNQRPRITFNKEGVCSACEFSSKKRIIDWEKRELELIDLCNKFRSKSGDYDVIVPCSGGKDGSFVAHQLKHQFGMNPLTVTWSPLKKSAIGVRNLDNFIQSGFNHIQGTANPKVTQKLTRLAFTELGDPFQPFIYGQSNFPLEISVRFQIPLIMYGENGEVEYGGDMKNADKPTRDVTDHDSHYFSGLPPEFWLEHGIKLGELRPFLSPEFARIKENRTEIHFMSYYKHWDPQENFYYAQKNTGFTPNYERSEGTYSKYASLDDEIDGFHYYLSYIKFGIGRATSDAAHEIRDGKISREEGVALVKKYDHERPKKYLKEFLQFCKITENEIEEVIDSWRSPHLWKLEEGKWQLRKAVWH